MSGDGDSHTNYLHSGCARQILAAFSTAKQQGIFLFVRPALRPMS
jgi:hypothetical protein